MCLCCLLIKKKYSINFKQIKVRAIVRKWKKENFQLKVRKTDKIQSLQGKKRELSTKSALNRYIQSLQGKKRELSTKSARNR